MILISFLQLQFTVEISYFEIYNEKIHDLLAPSKKKDNKRVQVNVIEIYIGKHRASDFQRQLLVTSLGIGVS